MKKIIVVAVVLFVLLSLFLVSCSQSVYETLTESQKNIVNTIIENEHKLCDYIKLTNYNGKLYLRTYDIEWYQSTTGISKAGLPKNQELYVVEENALTHVTDEDVYTSANTYYGGGVTSLTDAVSEEEKLEIISAVVKKALP